MLTRTTKYCDRLRPYVNDVLIFEETDADGTNRLPFFADGYPGIVFNIAANGVHLRPGNKRLTELFLYGQTLEPIELYVAGTFKMIVFQMFPFAVRILLGIDARGLNDDCHDLAELSGPVLERLRTTDRSGKQIDIISDLLGMLVEKSPFRPDSTILPAINLILQFKGKISVGELTDRLFLGERTLERRFLRGIGVPPKTFCRIVQFQSSLNQISATKESKMMDIVYENGFTDQSHFIRTFKKFTGMTPSEFQYLPALANFL